jgi:tetratricopeptide (TPR) repeat protein
MKIARYGLVALATILVFAASGCTRRKEVTERDRKEAAFLISEAQFAMTVREWARAEGLLVKAVAVAPQGDSWLSLGGVRMRLNNRDGAREAYQSALKAFEQESAQNNKASEPWVKQAFVLGLLGRKSDSQALITKAAKIFPNDAKIRALTDPKELERMFSTQNFKEMAL